MAATNSTPNLELSQFIGSDKPDWLTDYNGDMGKIDSSYGAVSAIAEEAAANAESAAASAAQATTDAAAAVSAVAGAVEAAQAAEAAAEQATTTATSALQIANGAATTAQGAAGDATTALSIAQNAKETAESAQAAAAQAAEDAAASAADAASSAAIASGVDSRVTAIEECIPASASSSNKLITTEELANDVLKITVARASGDTLGTMMSKLHTALSEVTENKYKNGLRCGAAFLYNGTYANNPARLSFYSTSRYDFATGLHVSMTGTPNCKEILYSAGANNTGKVYQYQGTTLTDQSSTTANDVIICYIFGVS